MGRLKNMGCMIPKKIMWVVVVVGWYASKKIKTRIMKFFIKGVYTKMYPLQQDICIGQSNVIILLFVFVLISS